ncbi:MAG: hypothetical protein RIB59_04675 [Rhodospirillales bacterium]
MEAILHRPNRLHPGFPFTTIWNGFKGFFTVVNRALEAQRLYTRMSSLSPAQLERLGLKRDDLPQFVAKKYF